MDRRDAVINSMNWHCAHTDKVATQQSGAVLGFLLFSTASYRAVRFFPELP